MMKKNQIGTTLIALAMTIGAASIGCDRDDTRDAAQTAGDNVEKAVNAVGEASRDAAHAVGNTMESAGDKLKREANEADATTRPAATPAVP